MRQGFVIAIGHSYNIIITSSQFDKSQNGSITSANGCILLHMFMHYILNLLICLIISLCSISDILLHISK